MNKTARAASSWHGPVKPDSVNVGGCERLAVAGIFVEYECNLNTTQKYYKHPKEPEYNF